MKALIVITGRGLGGDAVIAYNVISGLEAEGVQCELALDESAPGILFKKKGYAWHKISIPQAGGHAATKLSSIKAAFRMFTATFKVRRLINKLDVDFVVGIIGGGAIVASVGAKLSGKPCACICCTPLDMKVCPRFNHCIILPEYHLFREKNLPENLSKTNYPLNDDVDSGNSEIALEKLKEIPLFDENKKTILFSSGSSLFKGMIETVSNFSNYTDEYNLLLVGHPLHDEYMDLIDQDKIIYLGFVDWLNHLYKFIDLAVLTDDGVMVAELTACRIPIVTITHVKWGRYHNMAANFEGAILESSIGDANENITKAFENYDSLKENANKYSGELLATKANLAKKIIDICGK
ncbi:MAG: glycosyltransferase [Methanobrevibacter sp.]|uniref:glycosyltransferase n=1 Tax=Methanobrevibacter sp. TaxID=66852 RepID=UPI001B231EDC|nr:glycosyltransferase [Methanobrevibacter sp.]MBO5151939.1 glycosyltransferase [Methanobrevibacter sp.]MBO6110458.1 glycosyltransferase [Methanobrevibacter sp.]